MSALAINPLYAALLSKVQPRVIRSEEENETFTEIMYQIDQKEDATPEEQELSNLLLMLIEDFEEKNYSLARSTPLDTLEFFMDQHGMGAEDLQQFFESPESIADVLVGKRELRIEEIRKLSERFHVSPELFF